MEEEEEEVAEEEEAEVDDAMGTAQTVAEKAADAKADLHAPPPGAGEEKS